MNKGMEIQQRNKLLLEIAGARECLRKAKSTARSLCRDMGADEDYIVSRKLDIAFKELGLIHESMRQDYLDLRDSV